MINWLRIDLNFFEEVECILSELVEGVRVIRPSNKFDNVIDRTHEGFFILKQIANHLLWDGFFQRWKLFFCFQKPTIIPIPLNHVAHTDQGLMPHTDILNRNMCYILTFVYGDQHFEELKEMSFSINQEQVSFLPYLRGWWRTMDVNETLSDSLSIWIRGWLLIRSGEISIWLSLLTINIKENLDFFNIYHINHLSIFIAEMSPIIIYITLLWKVRV